MPDAISRGHNINNTAKQFWQHHTHWYNTSSKHFKHSDLYIAELISLLSFYQECTHWLSIKRMPLSFLLLFSQVCQYKRCCHIAPSCCCYAWPGCTPRLRPCPSSREASGTLQWTAWTAVGWWRWWGTRRKAQLWRRSSPLTYPCAPSAATVVSGSSSALTSVSESVWERNSRGACLWCFVIISQCVSVTGSAARKTNKLKDNVWVSMTIGLSQHQRIKLMYYPRGEFPPRDNAGVFSQGEASLWGILCSRLFVCLDTGRKEWLEQKRWNGKVKGTVGGREK